MPGTSHCVWESSKSVRLTYFDPDYNLLSSHEAITRHERPQERVDLQSHQSVLLLCLDCQLRRFDVHLSSVSGAGSTVPWVVQDAA